MNLLELATRIRDENPVIDRVTDSIRSYFGIFDTPDDEPIRGITIEDVERAEAEIAAGQGFIESDSRRFDVMMSQPSEISSSLIADFVNQYVNSKEWSNHPLHEYVTADIVLFILDKETYQRIDGDVTYYRNDFDGKFLGLGQFNSATWNSVMSLDFKDYATIPFYAVEATMRLIAANARTALNQAVIKSPSDWTKELSYLYHNQGAGAAKSYLVSNRLRSPKQSVEALKTFEVARMQNGQSIYEA